MPSGVQEISLDELTLTEGEAVGLTEAQQAGDARRCTEMYGDVRRCTEMHGDVGRCTEMHGDVRRCTEM